LSKTAVALFAGLVAATFAAFFVAQRLKTEPAIVKVGKVTRYFSPNGDGRKDRARFAFTLNERDEVRVNVLDADGNLVRRLRDNVRAEALKPVRMRWDGRDDAGLRAPDGRYAISVDLERQGRSVDVRGSSMFLDTTPPRPRVLRTSDTIVGPQPQEVFFRMRGVSARKPTQVEILRTDVEPFETVASLTVPPEETLGSWDVNTTDGPAEPGIYMVVIRVQDRAGNVGSAPPRIPPAARDIDGRPGITVRRLAVRTPERAIRAGEVVKFFVDARNRPYRWSLRRLGQGRPTKEGRSTNPALGMHAPTGPSGMYLLEVRAGRDRATAPILVQSRKRAELLVSVPAITWFGRAEVDDEHDGLPNTLPNGGPVAVPRVLGGLPDGLADEVAPLLVALDRLEIRYDLTTDFALTHSRDPRPTDRKAVILAGSHHWVQRGLARRLRRYVSDGGRIASFGVESLRAGVSVADNSLRRPTPATPVDAFGHRLERLRRPAQPEEGQPPIQLEVLEGPDAPLFEATSGVLTGFSVFEEARIVEDSSLDLEAAYGQNPTEQELATAEAEGKLPREALPIISQSRLGKGFVIRVGLPEWAARIGEDPQVSQITRNILDLLRGIEPKPRNPL
jgi:FlgD Ig-like domain